MGGEIIAAERSQPRAASCYLDMHGQKPQLGKEFEERVPLNDQRIAMYAESYADLAATLIASLSRRGYMRNAEGHVICPV